jgi:redox-sensing transcriptional repressor
VVGAFDVDPKRIGQHLVSLSIQPLGDLRVSGRTSGAEIGILAVPAAAAQEVYDLLVDAGIRSVLNFAPVQLRRSPDVRTKTVDLRIHLEELVFYSATDPTLGDPGADGE